MARIKNDILFVIIFLFYLFILSIILFIILFIYYLFQSTVVIDYSYFDDR